MNGLLDRKQILGVDRQFELVGQALAIVPGQGDRGFIGQGHAGGGGPDGVVIGDFNGLPRGGGPAILHIIGVCVRPRLQQAHERRIRGQRLPIVSQHEVIETPAEQADRTAHLRRIDLNPGHDFGDRWRGLGDRARAAGGLRRFGLMHHRGGRFGQHRRDERLIAQQNAERDRDREEESLLVH